MQAVRFYWSRDEAELPFAAIPEQDREPLRVRRSLVHARAPEVIKQLEAGRFVAAAWEADGILLIGCHPNLAKGEFDAFLIDTRSLPQVVLRLQEWGEAPQVARLFLAAFGSEVTTPEECLEARRKLVEWLESHGQAGMAGIVRGHFRLAPGFRPDALEIINRWRNVLIHGRKEQLERFLEEAGRRFEGLGWSRDGERERAVNSQPHQGNRFSCWVSGRGMVPRVMLCLNRATDRRVRGGTYDVLDEQGTLIDLAVEIDRVLGQVIEPAAADAGVVVAYARLGPISRVGPRTMAALTALGEAGGEWPLSKDVEALWRKFLFAACREDVALKPEELTAWFQASGWDEAAAAELSKRFYNDAALIEEYEEAGSQGRDDTRARDRSLPSSP
jgi:hypothetical protein